VGDWFDAIDCPTDMEGDDGWNKRYAEATRVHVGYGHFTGVEAPHEELWVMDHEGFQGLLTGECSPMEAQALAEILERVPEHQRGAFGAYVADHVGLDYASRDWDSTLSDFEEAYAGEWDSEREFAENLADDIGLLTDAPEALALYFNWDAWTCDIFLGDYSTSPAPFGGVWVFNRNV